MTIRERINRLNIWQRLGIIATVLWIGITAPLGTDELRNQAIEPWTRAYDECVAEIGNQPACLDQGAAAERQYMAKHWPNIAVAVLATPLLAWIFAYVAAWLGRWVWAGRKPSGA